MRQVAFCVVASWTLIACCSASWIPGCYSVWDLNKLYEEAAETGSYQDIPSCFCDNATDIHSDGVQVSCLFGSTMEDLGSVLDSVSAASKQAVNIHISHVNFGESNAIPAGFFHKHNATPDLLIITACPGRQPISIEDDAFAGMELNLTQLVINDCKLNQVPSAINNLTSLEFLEIRYSLLSVQDGAFSRLSRLKQLNLSENYLHSLDAGSLRGLQSLERLVLGPKNYFNETIFQEINGLSTLKHLDLQNVQLQNVPDRAFMNLTELRTLLLTGNNIINLTSLTFKGLNQVETLDLRVNLIENTEDGTFGALPNLEELNLAGNYIDDVHSELFEGLQNLKRLDLGWNEFSEIPDYTFDNMPNLELLDLRHNLKLGSLSTKSLEGLSQLIHLNLSKTNITELNKQVFGPLENLQKLELTKSPITELPSSLFHSNSKLLHLALNHTHLKTLPVGIFDPLFSLELIDLSGNPWLCDDQLAETIDWIFSRLYTAAETSVPFFFQNSNETTCDRPYSVRGKQLMDLETQTLQTYDPDSDTTTGTTTEEIPTAEATTYPETYPPLLDSTTVETEDMSEMESEQGTQPPPDPDKPEKGLGSAALGIIVAVIIAALLTIVVIGVIVFAMKKRKESRGSTPTNTGSTEMVQKHQQPTTRRTGEADIIRDAPVIKSESNGDYSNHAYV